jgi:hypothetical protein
MQERRFSGCGGEDESLLEVKLNTVRNTEFLKATEEPC